MKLRFYETLIYYGHQVYYGQKYGTIARTTFIFEGKNMVDCQKFFNQFIALELWVTMEKQWNYGKKTMVLWIYLAFYEKLDTTPKTMKLWFIFDKKLWYYYEKNMVLTIVNK